MRTERTRQWTQGALIAGLAVGCALVLRPFFPALLFSAVIAVSTWPGYRWLRWRLGRRASLGAALMCVLVTAILIVPATLVVTSFSDALVWLLGVLEEWSRSPPAQPPGWAAGLPLLGDALGQWWAQWVAGDGHLMRILSASAGPAGKVALASGRVLAAGLLQVTMSIVLLWFLYTRGESLGAWTMEQTRQLGGEFGCDLLLKARESVVGVMISVIGTALAQASVAIVGFTVAGVPNPILLGALTFVLSMVPIGPPLLWGGAALWLFRNQHEGWALFMAVYGLLGISSIDNVLKPFLISRSTHLPFAITLMGAVGGVFAFGVMGVFLGPVFLALAITLARALPGPLHEEALGDLPPSNDSRPSSSTHARPAARSGTGSGR